MHRFPSIGGTPSSRSQTRDALTRSPRGKKAEKGPDPEDWRAVEREDQIRVQQEMLKRRKSGEYVAEANDRRKKVKVRAVRATRCQAGQDTDLRAVGTSFATKRECSGCATEQSGSISCCQRGRSALSPISWVCALQAPLS